MEPRQWQPTKAYNVAFTGDIVAIERVLPRWEGVIYTYDFYPQRAMLVVPAIVNLKDINTALATDGGAAFIEGWWEEGGAR